MENLELLLVAAGVRARRPTPGNIMAGRGPARRRPLAAHTHSRTV